MSRSSFNVNVWGLDKLLSAQSILLFLLSLLYFINFIECNCFTTHQLQISFRLDLMLFPLFSDDESNQVKDFPSPAPPMSHTDHNILTERQIKQMSKCKQTRSSCRRCVILSIIALLCMLVAMSFHLSGRNHSHQFVVPSTWILGNNYQGRLWIVETCMEKQLKSETIEAIVDNINRCIFF